MNEDKNIKLPPSNSSGNSDLANSLLSADKIMASDKARNEANQGSWHNVGGYFSFYPESMSSWWFYIILFFVGIGLLYYIF